MKMYFLSEYDFRVYVKRKVRIVNILIIRIESKKFLVHGAFADLVGLLQKTRASTN